MEFHDAIAREGGIEVIIEMASLEDIECQEYAAFSLAHMASNRDYQTYITKAGGLKPLVAMMSVHAEPRHYAGLALLKLADNFENHISIAEEGGIQALLRLARARSTDEELQYKAALTVGHLASNAVRLLPQPGAKNSAGGNSSGKLGGAARSKAGDRTRACKFPLFML